MNSSGLLLVPKFHAGYSHDAARLVPAFHHRALLPLLLLLRRERGGHVVGAGVRRPDLTPAAQDRPEGAFLSVTSR